MQQVCLLFAGRRGLDNQNVRNSVLRIPEVSRKLKTAQQIIDSTYEGTHTSDLFAFVQSPDQEYNSKASLKSLVASIVQIGLFDRYVKYRSRPSFLIGRMNGTSALKVCAGKISFEEFILQSEYFQEVTSVTPLVESETRLTGVSLEEYGAFRWNNNGDYEAFEIEAKEASKIVEELSLENLVNQCIHIGPCYEFRMEEFAKDGLQAVSSISSIDLDPILTSFWKSA